MCHNSFAHSLNTQGLFAILVCSNFKPRLFVSNKYLIICSNFLCAVGFVLSFALSIPWSCWQYQIRSTFQQNHSNSRLVLLLIHHRICMLLIIGIPIKNLGESGDSRLWTFLTQCWGGAIFTTFSFNLLRILLHKTCSPVVFHTFQQQLVFFDSFYSIVDGLTNYHHSIIVFI